MKFQLNQTQPKNQRDPKKLILQTPKQTKLALNGNLEGEVLLSPPPKFEDKFGDGKIYSLNKATNIMD